MPDEQDPHWDRKIPLGHCRVHLRQVVTIHQAMFEKLLFDENASVGLELAELFDDASRTYLQISKRINETYLSQHSLQD